MTTENELNSDGFVLISLSKLMSTMDFEDVQDILAAYHCVKDSSTESFLKERAIEMERRDLSRTYLAINLDEEIVLGYVSLSIKCINVPEDNLLSNKALRNMNIEAETGVAQSYLLGQLSRSDEAPKGFGKILLDFAFDKLSEAKSIVGCRTVRLDCHDELIQYYNRHGFMLINRNSGSSLNRMVAFV